MKIAIYGSRHQDEYIEQIVSLLSTLVSEGHCLIVHSKLWNYLVDRSAMLPVGVDVRETPVIEADLALSIGGDGTFLRTAQWIADSETPIVGVNTGHLGFLAPFTLGEALEAVRANCVDSYEIIDRSVLFLDSPEGLPFDFWPYALNEVAILKRDTASMICVSTTINRAPLAEYLCDGLIVSTPTGSTGYNLSVGGPIVQPGSPSIVLSPVAAHSLSMRPLVVDDDSHLQMRVTSRASTFRVSLDGRSISLPAGSVLNIGTAHFVVRTVQKPDHNFFATLREKLLWGVNHTRL